MKGGHNAKHDLHYTEDEALELEMLLLDHYVYDKPLYRLHTRRAGPARREITLNSIRNWASNFLPPPSSPSSRYTAPRRYSLYLALSAISLQIPPRTRFRPRTLIFYIAFILIWAPIALLCLVLAYGGIPPHYGVVRRWERQLPQHIWTSAPEVRSRIEGHVSRNPAGVSDDGRRYLRFPDHLWGHGLNNVLQEAILTSHLAYQANRTFVFEDFTWSHLPSPYTLYDFALRPTRVPLGAFVGGWLTGGASVDDTQRGDVDSKGSKTRDGGSEEEPSGSSADGHFDGSDGAHEPLPPLNLTTANTWTPENVRNAIAERRPVSAEYFDFVCPPRRRVEIWYGRGSEFPPGHDASGLEIMEWWTRRLQQPDVRDEPCVVVREEQRRVFDSNFFGSTRIHSLFEHLKRSLVLNDFAWSHIVQGALQRTVAHFFNTSATKSKSARSSRLDSAASSSALSNSTSNSMIQGVLAVHLRRGDYKRHCLRLSEWNAGYMGFNRFEGMLDTFDVDNHLRRISSTTISGTGSHTRSVEDDVAAAELLRHQREAYYLAHCLPSIPVIVQRLHDVREEYQRSVSPHADPDSSPEYALRDVYVLTNGWPAFVDALRNALLADGWARVVGTPQLDGSEPLRAVPSDADDQEESVPTLSLTREEKGVSVAVDMGIAEKAEVFVGNGFSSLSSNIVMLRMAKGMPMYSNRLL